MILVPLLLGVTVLTIAVLSRLEEIDRAGIPQAKGDGDPVSASPDSPLQTAFPHLNLWIPTSQMLPFSGGSDAEDDRHVTRGVIGPDIIIGPWRDTARRPRTRYSDAA